MTPTGKAILTAAIVGGVCGIAGAAFYVVWRAHDRRADERVTGVLKQLETVADRMQGALPPAATTDVRGIPVRLPDLTSRS
jgi:hypothetical protein